MKKNIRNKIMLSYTVIIFISVFALEMLFLIYVKNYYYASAQNFLLSKANDTYNYYNKYMIYDKFENKINHIYNNNIIKDEKIKFQIINKNHISLIDSYGFYSNDKISTPDVIEGLKGNMQVFELNDKSENILAICIPIKRLDTIEGVVRYTISLENIKNTISKMQGFALLCGIIVIVLVLVIGLILAESITVPIEKLKEAANEVARGNFKIRPEKIHNDEIGELSQTFCYMAEEIEKSEKIKNEFISSISHELRTPLTSIKGWSETLSYGCDKDEIDLGLNVITKETDRLINLVEELLDFSKFQANNIKMNFELINIDDCLTEVVNQFIPKATENNINLCLNLNSSIKNIRADNNRLKQVFINFIHNSLKFTSYGGYINISTYDEDNKLIICFNDNGEGIEKENLDKVLNKFFQENHKKAGSGLGLSICLEIIKLHKGEIMIDSEKGKGTNIKVILGAEI